jgi:hypothetical protein
MRTGIPAALKNTIASVFAQVIDGEQTGPIFAQQPLRFLYFRKSSHGAAN